MKMKKGRAEPRKDKIEAVDALSAKISKYPVIGVMSLHKVPADALQKIRGELSEAVIKVERKAVIEKALEKSGRADLIKMVSSQPAVIMSAMNPFKLYKFIIKKKSKAAAKPGDIAPDDIMVSAGPTDIPPGPAISALSKVKIPAKVEGGKIAVSKDVIVAKKGDVISAELASALSMLKVQPMEIGLDISALTEGGVFYGRDALNVDEAQILADIGKAALQAFNLSLNSGYPTKQTIGLMITKAFLNAKTLGLEAGILDSGVIEDLLAKAKRQADALASKIPAQ
jgi:large subunit ribosomal protein L10